MNSYSLPLLSSFHEISGLVADLVPRAYTFLTTRRGFAVEDGQVDYLAAEKFFELICRRPASCQMCTFTVRPGIVLLRDLQIGVRG